MTRSALTLRAARPDDAPVLAQLWAEVLQRGHEDEHVEHCRVIVERAEERRDESVIVAEYDGELAGAVYLQQTTISPLNAEPMVLALSPHVFDNYRRRGAGTALLEAAVAFAEELGVGHVGAPVVSASRESNRFLARLSLAPVAVLRVAPTATLRSKIAALRPAQRGSGQIDRILASRRLRRRDTFTR